MARLILKCVSDHITALHAIDAETNKSIKMHIKICDQQLVPLHFKQQFPMVSRQPDFLLILQCARLLSPSYSWAVIALTRPCWPSTVTLTDFYSSCEFHTQTTSSELPPFLGARFKSGHPITFHFCYNPAFLIEVNFT